MYECRAPAPRHRSHVLQNRHLIQSSDFYAMYQVVLGTHKTHIKDVRARPTACGTTHTCSSLLSTERELPPSSLLSSTSFTSAMIPHVMRAAATMMAKPKNAPPLAGMLDLDPQSFPGIYSSSNGEMEVLLGTSSYMCREIGFAAWRR